MRLLFVCDRFCVRCTSTFFFLLLTSVFMLVFKWFTKNYWTEHKTSESVQTNSHLSFAKHCGFGFSTRLQTFEKKFYGTSAFKKGYWNRYNWFETIFMVLVVEFSPKKKKNSLKLTRKTFYVDFSTDFFLFRPIFPINSLDF